ncbi:MAG TPA: hypothetical protein VN796_06210 [Acidimicrobiales bacterium]|nr:hypothetical protein [Acidimicrobiales bacterium]
MKAKVAADSALAQPDDHEVDGPPPDAGETPDPYRSDGATERILLNVGSPYFHDGRIGPEHYASDMAPTLLAVITASHTLLREFFTEMGAPVATGVAARCGEWELRYGATPGEAQLVQGADTGREGSSAPATTGVDPNVDEWVRGVVASRDADHSQALSAFEAEAAEAVQSGSPQRAAIAYRAASAAARAAGRADDANRLMRLAGKSYLDIAELSDTIPQGVFMAFREGARCFLDAGNLPLAHTCLSKAIAIGETLGYTEST